MAQVKHMLLEVIDDAAGSADQHVDAFLGMRRCLS